MRRTYTSPLWVLPIGIVSLLAQDSPQPDPWQTLSKQARAAYAEKDYGRSERLYLMAIEAAGGMHQANSRVAENLHFLGIVYNAMERRDKALEAFRRSLSIIEELHGPDSLEAARAIPSVASAMDQLGYKSEAEALFVRAVEIHERILGPDHIFLAAPLQSLARTYNLHRKYAEAERAAKRALEIVAKEHGPDSPAVAQPLFLLAGVFSSQGRVGEAEAAYLRCIELATGTAETKTLASYLSSLALLYRRSGRYAEAERLYTPSIEALEKKYGSESEFLPGALQAYATLLRQMGRPAEAASVLERFERLRSKSPQPKKPPRN